MRVLHSFVFGSASLLALVTGCSSSAPLPEAIGSSTEELSTSIDRLVIVRRDVRKCVSPLCGGYWTRELNHDEDELYVSSIDLSSAGLDDAAVADARSVDALVLRGRLAPPEPRFRTRAFIASEVWRGLPGISAGQFEDFYTVAPRTPPIECLVAPCPNEIATLVDTCTRYAVDGVDVAPAARPFVDRTWLASRVTGHQAVVTASWVEGDHFPGGYARLLRTSQVYVRLPDRVGPCPAAPVTKCPEGTIAAYQRTADRCVIQVACVRPAFCPMYVPACADGYTLASWTSESGCPQYACDPTFVAN
jgi:hypothetical protein